MERNFWHDLAIVIYQLCPSDFQFGAAPVSGTSAFAGFGAPNAAGTTSLFGQQNGLAPQTNGLPQPSATAGKAVF